MTAGRVESPTLSSREPAPDSEWMSIGNGEPPALEHSNVPPSSTTSAVVSGSTRGFLSQARGFARYFAPLRTVSVSRQKKLP